MGGNVDDQGVGERLGRSQARQTVEDEQLRLRCRRWGIRTGDRSGAQFDRRSFRESPRQGHPECTAAAQLAFEIHFATEKLA